MFCVNLNTFWILKWEIPLAIEKLEKLSTHLLALERCEIIFTFHFWYEKAKWGQSFNKYSDLNLSWKRLGKRWNFLPVLYVQIRRNFSHIYYVFGVKKKNKKRAYSDCCSLTRKSNQNKKSFFLESSKWEKIEENEKKNRMERVRRNCAKTIILSLNFVDGAINESMN